tara:strand:+ start:1168 stop:1374 length:207 start_codon:yes stop_codon:yes gene_type:complete
MRLFLLLPLLLGFSVPVVAHNEFNGGVYGYYGPANPEGVVEGAETGDTFTCPPTCGGGVPRPVRPISN